MEWKDVHAELDQVRVEVREPEESPPRRIPDPRWIRASEPADRLDELDAGMQAWPRRDAAESMSGRSVVIRSAASRTGRTRRASRSSRPSSHR
jgi:hypothetical protein